MQQSKFPFLQTTHNADNEPNSMKKVTVTEGVLL
jgi:hypothetical protein